MEENEKKKIIVKAKTNTTISEIAKKQIEESKYPVVGAIFNNEYKNLDELKKKYQAGGLGDVVIKKFLNNILQDVLEPIREKRKYYENHIDEVIKILENGTIEARKRASRTLEKVKSSMKIDYFKNDDFLNEAIDKYK